MDRQQHEKDTGPSLSWIIVQLHLTPLVGTVVTLFSNLFTITIELEIHPIMVTL